MRNRNTSSKVPSQLRAGLTALLVLTSAGTGVYMVVDRNAEELQRHEYVQAVAQDPSTPLDVKLAMVMAAYYESSYRHIGVPYVDKLGKGQPLTVCAGITGAGVVSDRTYKPADCYNLEKGRYTYYRSWVKKDIQTWEGYPVFFRATVLDFLHNKGTTAFSNSTMRRKILAGDLEGACAENPKWNRGTVNGVSTVLPGLQVRGDSNSEICLWDDPIVEVSPASLDAEVIPEEPVPEPSLEVVSAPAEPVKLPWWKRIFTRN